MHWQAAWVVTRFTSWWRLTPGPDISKRVWLLVRRWLLSKARAATALWHMGTLDIHCLSWYSWLQTSNWLPESTYLVKQLSLNQKQTPSPLLSPPSIIDADPLFSFLLLCLLQHAPIPALPKSPARSLLAPRCFSLLFSLKCVGEMEHVPPFTHFYGCFGGQRIVGPGPRSHAASGRIEKRRERIKEGKNEVIYYMSQKSCREL